MQTRSLLFLFALTFFIAGSLSCGSKPAAEAVDDELLVLETNYGRIVIEFLSQDAPLHAAHYKQLAREGFYDGTRFHRIVKDKKGPKAIQGGNPNSASDNNSLWDTEKPGLERVPAEFSKTLTHRRGAVSAARNVKDENSATSQFFICVADSPEWDGVYSIFGRVIEGMRVVDLIARAPVFPRTDVPLDGVVVNKAYIARRGELN
jgi:cyclophilin family peptidyl-prolyl cis-trans isomerase